MADLMTNTGGIGGKIVGMIATFIGMLIALIMGIIVAVAVAQSVRRHAPSHMHAHSTHARKGNLLAAGLTVRLLVCCFCVRSQRRSFTMGRT